MSDKQVESICFVLVVLVWCLPSIIRAWRGR